MVNIEESENPELEPKRVPRRRFLEASVLVTTSVVSASLLGVGGRFVVGDALEAKGEQWVPLGEMAKFPQGQMHRVTYSVRKKDAWRTTESKGLLYLVSEDGATYQAISAVCTHLGCNVHLNEETGGFRCPCHDAYFSASGEVVSGPPRRGLVQLQTKVEAETVSVLV